MSVQHRVARSTVHRPPPPSPPPTAREVPLGGEGATRSLLPPAFSRLVTVRNNHESVILAFMAIRPCDRPRPPATMPGRMDIEFPRSFPGLTTGAPSATSAAVMRHCNIPTKPHNHHPLCAKAASSSISKTPTKVPFGYPAPSLPLTSLSHNIHQPTTTTPSPSLPLTSLSHNIRHVHGQLLATPHGTPEDHPQVRHNGLPPHRRTGGASQSHGHRGHPHIDLQPPRGLEQVPHHCGVHDQQHSSLHNTTYPIRA